MIDMSATQQQKLDGGPSNQELFHRTEKIVEEKITTGKHVPYTRRERKMIRDAMKEFSLLNKTIDENRFQLQRVWDVIKGLQAELSLYNNVQDIYNKHLDGMAKSVDILAENQARAFDGMTKILEIMDEVKELAELEKAKRIAQGIADAATEPFDSTDTSSPESQEEADRKQEPYFPPK